MESLAKFPRRTSTSSGLHGQNQQPEEQQHQQQQQQQQRQQPSQQSQQPVIQNPNSNDQNSAQSGAMQASNGAPSVNNAINMSSAPTSQNTIAGLLHQNSMNSRPKNPMSNANSPYGGSSVQMPSPGSSSTMQQALNPSPFQSPTLASSNNPPQTSHGALTANSPAISNIQHQALSGEGDTTDAQSSVQKIIQEMMMSTQLNSGGSMMGIGSLGNEMKNVSSALNGAMGNGTTSSNPSVSGAPFGGMGQPSMINGMRASLGNNNSVGMNGRVGIPSMMRDQSMSHQQQDLGSQMLGGLGMVNGFNNLHFDWKPSP